MLLQKIIFDTSVITSEDGAVDESLLPSENLQGGEKRKQLKKHISTLEHLALKIINASNTPMILLGPGGRVRIWNTAAVRMFGYSSKEAMGQLLTELIIPEKDKNNHSEGFKQFQKTGTGPVIDVTINTQAITKQGELIDIALSVSRIDLGDKFYAFGNIADISNLRKADKLLHQKEAAEEANRAKSIFLAAISHEIRTPLNAVIGMTDVIDITIESIIKDFEANKYSQVMEKLLRMKTQMNTVATSGNILSELICGVLDISKIEAGQYELEAIPFCLYHTLGDVRDVLHVQASDKSIKLNCLDPDLEVPVFVGDPLAIKKIVLNLVSNAIKFTQVGGTVSVNAQVLEEKEDRILIQFVVTDTGEGIAQEQLHTIFDPFTQADASITRRHGGTGLGLAISKGIVGLMDGKIWVESAGLGLGSQFNFQVWLKVANESEELALEETHAKRSIPQAVLNGISVLIVDDDQNNRSVIGFQIEALEGNPEYAINGQEAIALLQEGRHFDMILMDVRMPVMDGYQTTSKIRGCESDRKLPRRPIIAITADATTEARRRCFEVGMDGFVTKPVRTEGILAEAVRLGLIEDSVVSSCVTPSPTADIQRHVNGDSTSVQLINWPEFGKALGNDVGFMDTILGTLIVDAHAQYEAMLNFIESNNIVDFREAAHSLKGSSSNIGKENGMWAACFKLQQMGDNNNINGVKEIMAELKILLGQLEDEYLEWKM